MQGRLVCAGVAALCCAQGAMADWVGGALVTRSEWNDAASATLGQTASVFRLYFAFDEAGDLAISPGEVFLDVRQGTLYQDALGGNTPPPPVFSFVPSLEWDSYVSGGNLYSPSNTYPGQTFFFTPTGLADPVFGEGSSWGTPGVNAGGEGVARAPGALDQNGDMVVPADFDSRFVYAFSAQFTVLGLDAADTAPIWDGGFIYADWWEGVFGVFTWQRSSGLSEQPLNIPVGVPSPGGASALLLTMGVWSARRRR